MEKISYRTWYGLGACCIALSGACYLLWQPLEQWEQLLRPAALAAVIIGLMELVVASSSYLFKFRQYAELKHKWDKDPQPTIIAWVRNFVGLLVATAMTVQWFWNLEPQEGLVRHSMMLCIWLMSVKTIVLLCYLIHLSRVVFLSPEKYMAYKKRQQEIDARAAKARERTYSESYYSSHNDNGLYDGGYIDCGGSDSGD